jgi:DNA-binding transcriptional ArsR family regulator
MGATKYEFYTDELINTAELLKSVAHPARLQALLLIANETDKDITCIDIMEKIGLSQSTLSVHLKKLSDAGLIKMATITITYKTFTCYRINKPALKYLFDLLDHLFTKTNIKNDDQYESFHKFYAKVKSMSGWNSCFQT